MPTAADGDLQPGLAAEPDGAHDVADGLALGDDTGAPVDRGVEQDPGLVVARVTGYEDPSRETGAQFSHCQRVRRHCSSPRPWITVACGSGCAPVLSSRCHPAGDRRHADLVRYRVLGPLEVADSRGGSLSLSGSRQRALVAVLLAHDGHVVPADRLAHSIWGEQQPADPVAALQSQVSRLRTRLGHGALLETAGRGYRLRHAPHDLDAAIFERRLAEARGAVDPGQALRLLDSALSLWRGPAYQDHRDDLDVRIAADRLDDLREIAREDRAAALLALGRSDEAVAQASSLLTEHPLRERAVATLVEACCGAGRLAEALAAYESYRATLAEELGLDPGEDLRRLHLRVLRGEPDPTRRRATVPRPVTSYVDRDDEVNAVARAVRDMREATLTGPGGVGKTRLAIEVAARLGEFPDGAWFCDLAAVSDAAAVPAAVASILAIQRLHGRSISDRLVEVLDGRRALLVLDNCEHVREAAAGLVHRIVEHTADVHVLATSREPLGVPGEHRILVEPLPDDSAARLFHDRATAVRPGLHLTAEDVQAVRRICREVDGLPLAVELAAARAAARTPSEIAADLEGRVDQLSAPRSGPATTARSRPSWTGRWTAYPSRSEIWPST
ncbi:AfsR/SARP family transcriptional regulator [Geodermatophilus sp. SYSU D01176]